MKEETDMSQVPEAIAGVRLPDESRETVTQPCSRRTLSYLDAPMRDAFDDATAYRIA